MKAKLKFVVLKRKIVKVICKIKFDENTKIKVIFIGKKELKKYPQLITSYQWKFEDNSIDETILDNIVVWKIKDYLYTGKQK